MRLTSCVSVIVVICGVQCGAVTLAELYPAADAIVVGDVLTTTNTPTMMSFDITVNRVLKGTNVPAVCHVAHPYQYQQVAVGPRGPAATLALQIRGLWFLQDNGAGAWDVLLARNGAGYGIGPLFLPASVSESAMFAPNATATPLDAVVLEIGAGSLSSPDPSYLLGVLGSLNSDAVNRVFSALLSVQLSRFQAVGLAGLISHAAPGSLSQLQEVWPQVENDPAREYILTEIGNRYRVSTAESIRGLAALTTGAAVGSELRLAAIRAMASMYTEDAVRVLGTLLSSSSPAERMLAVFGVSSFANGCPAQTSANVVSMEYLKCGLQTPYRSDDTVAHLAFPTAPAPEADTLAAYWSGWWKNHPELH